MTTESLNCAGFTLIEILVAVGLLLYGGVGIDAVLLGGNFLDYSVLAHDPVHGQHLGILLVELTDTPTAKRFSDNPTFGDQLLETTFSTDPADPSVHNLSQ